MNKNIDFDYLFSCEKFSFFVFWLICKKSFMPFLCYIFCVQYYWVIHLFYIIEIKTSSHDMLTQTINLCSYQYKWQHKLHQKNFFLIIYSVQVQCNTEKTLFLLIIWPCHLITYPQLPVKDNISQIYQKQNNRVDDNGS